MHITKENHMQIIDTITAISFFLISIALTALIVFRLWDMRKAILPRHGSDAKAIMKRALRQLNVNADWTQDKDTTTSRFVYQGGHFSIEIVEGRKFATVNYLYFYKADMDSIENVRAVCNLCNLNAENCRIVYTVDGKDNCVDVHFISEIPVAQDSVEESLQLTMGNAFRWQNTFTKKLEDLGKNKKSDQEKKAAEIDGELGLLREQEMAHQPEGPGWHETPSEPYSLGHVLSTTMGLTDIVPIGLTMAGSETARTMTNANDILGMSIHEVLIEDGKFKHKSAFSKLDFYDPRDLSEERHMMIDFEAEGQTKDTLYYRVTLSLSPAALDGETDDCSWKRQKSATSIMIGYDLTPSDERLAHFHYVWKEAMAKVNSGDEENMTDEEKTIANMQRPHIAENFHIGRQLYLQKRFYEALGHLTDAYHELEAIWTGNDRIGRDSIHETAYLIACCYMSLRQYEKACFYIQATAPFGIGKYTKVYINSLVNNKDFRALDAIDTLLDDLSRWHENNFLGSDDDDDDQYDPNEAQLDSFISFAKRRKAYLLVDLGRYGEAEAMLTKMLNEPENSDFALNELAYIQKNK